MSVWIHKTPQNRSRCHTTDCSAYKNADGLREVTEDAAKRMGLEECTFCSGERKTQTHDYGYIEALENADPTHCISCGGLLRESRDVRCAGCAHKSVYND